MNLATNQRHPPTTSADFDRAYRAPFTLWGDLRTPAEVLELARARPGQRILELGCGLGRYSRHLAQEGHHLVGVDFSALAILKARARVAHDAGRPEFVVGDVTDLRGVAGPFDASFDVGCFHCLDRDQQARYAAEVLRLLAPGGTHLIWVMDDAPSGLPVGPADVERVFAPGFTLRRAVSRRRRLVRSHWYWLERRPLA